MDERIQGLIVLLLESETKLVPDIEGRGNQFVLSVQLNNWYPNILPAIVFIIKRLQREKKI